MDDSGNIVDLRFVLKFEGDSIVEVRRFDPCTDVGLIAVDFDIMRSMCPNYSNFLDDSLDLYWSDLGLRYIGG